MPRLRTISFLALALLIAVPAYAGTIDSTYKYAWSDMGGFVNFKPTNGGVVVNDSTLTGYAWAANTGWISFDTAQSGVSNDGNGTLGGFAWSEGEGWLSFTGVSIDSNGKFHGTATGADSTLTFDCTNCDVRTDWRVAVASSGSSGGSSGSSGGGIILNTPTTDTPTTPPNMPGTPYTPSGSEGEDMNGSTTEPVYVPNTEPTTISPALETSEPGVVPETFPWPLVISGIGFFFLLLFLLFRFFFRRS